MFRYLYLLRSESKFVIFFIIQISKPLGEYGIMNTYVNIIFPVTTI